MSTVFDENYWNILQGTTNTNTNTTCNHQVDPNCANWYTLATNIDGINEPAFRNYVVESFRTFNLLLQASQQNLANNYITQDKLNAVSSILTQAFQDLIAKLNTVDRSVVTGNVKVIMDRVSGFLQNPALYPDFTADEATIKNSLEKIIDSLLRRPNVGNDPRLGNFITELTLKTILGYTTLISNDEQSITSSDGLFTTKVTYGRSSSTTETFIKDFNMVVVDNRNGLTIAQGSLSKVLSDMTAYLSGIGISETEKEDLVIKSINNVICDISGNTLENYTSLDAANTRLGDLVKGIFLEQPDNATQVSNAIQCFVNNITNPLLMDSDKQALFEPFIKAISGSMITMLNPNDGGDYPTADSAVAALIELIKANTGLSSAPTEGEANTLVGDLFTYFTTAAPEYTANFYNLTTLKSLEALADTLEPSGYPHEYIDIPTAQTDLLRLVETVKGLPSNADTTKSNEILTNLTNIINSAEPAYKTAFYGLLNLESLAVVADVLEPTVRHSYTDYDTGITEVNALLTTVAGGTGLTNLESLGIIADVLEPTVQHSYVDYTSGITEVNALLSAIIGGGTPNPLTSTVEQKTDFINSLTSIFSDLPANIKKLFLDSMADAIKLSTDANGDLLNTFTEALDMSALEAMADALDPTVKHYYNSREEAITAVNAAIKSILSGIDTSIYTKKDSIGISDGTTSGILANGQTKIHTFEGRFVDYFDSETFINDIFAIKDPNAADRPLAVTKVLSALGTPTLVDGVYNFTPLQNSFREALGLIEVVKTNTYYVYSLTVANLLPTVNGPILDFINSNNGIIGTKQGLNGLIVDGFTNYEALLLDLTKPYDSTYDVTDSSVIIVNVYKISNGSINRATYTELKSKQFVNVSAVNDGDSTIKITLKDSSRSYITAAFAVVNNRLLTTLPNTDKPLLTTPFNGKLMQAVKYPSTNGDIDLTQFTDLSDTSIVKQLEDNYYIYPTDYPATGNVQLTIDNNGIEYYLDSKGTSVFGLYLEV